MGIPRAEIVTHDGLCALRQPVERHIGKLHHACQHRHRTHGHISAVAQEGGIEADGNEALGRLHHKRGKPQRNARQHDLTAHAEVFASELPARLLPGEEGHHPHGRHRLREHRRQRGKRRPRHAHVKHKNKHRVERSVEQRTEEHRFHTHGGKTLRRDVGVHTKRELNKNRAEGVNTHIVKRVAHGVLARAEEQQQSFGKHFKEDRQHKRCNEQHRQAVAHNAL